MGSDLQIPAGLEGLREIVLNHLCRVPGGNVSKLLLFAGEGRGRPLALTEFLDGIEYRDLGGTCHSNNPFLAGLLRALGYEADLLGADMSRPNIHTCIEVRIDSAAYHVDCGYGAPFREPVRLDRLPAEFIEGRVRFRVARRTEDGRIGVDVLAGEERLHGYARNETPRAFEFFTGTILDSFGPGQTFMTCLWIKRYFADRAVDLIDHKLSIHSGESTTATELRDMAELKAAVAEVLEMPRCPVEEAVSTLEQLTGKDLFATG